LTKRVQWRFIAGTDFTSGGAGLAITLNLSRKVAIDSWLLAEGSVATGQWGGNHHRWLGDGFNGLMEKRMTIGLGTVRLRLGGLRRALGLGGQLSDRGHARARASLMLVLLSCGWLLALAPADIAQAQTYKFMNSGSVDSVKKPLIGWHPNPA
jgi:hypothetical protein